MAKSRFVAVAFVSLMLASLHAQAVPLSDGATAEPGASDYEITGRVFFGAGEYSGKISGEGTAVIETGGNASPCIFSNGGNSYGGGTIVSNAVFQVDATGAASTGVISNMTNDSHLYINCPRLVNDLYFAGFFNETGNDPTTSNRPLRPLVDTVIDGSIVCASRFTVISGLANMASGKKMEVTGDIVCRNGSLSVGVYGNVVFRGRVDLDAKNDLNVGVRASCTGIIDFYASSNSVQRIESYNPRQNLRARDAFPDADLAWNYGTMDNVNQAVYYLYGNDQTFGGFTWRTATDHLDAPETGKGLGIYAGTDETDTTTPATVRITGSRPALMGSHTYDLKAGLFGNLTYVMDVQPGRRSGFYQNFIRRRSTMSGDLIISNGDFRVSGTASFPNVPRIYVGESGKFTCTTAKTGAFAACTALVVDGEMTFGDDVAEPFGYKQLRVRLGKGARLTLPEDYKLTVLSVTVVTDDGEVELPEDTYPAGGAIPQLLGGSITVEKVHEDTSATWTGGADDDLFTSAANWSTSPTCPDFDYGTLLATFAEGGSRAELDRDVKLRGLVLDKPDTGFAFAGADRALQLAGDAGLTLADAEPGTDGAPKAYVFEPSVSILSKNAPLALSVPTNTAVEFRGGIQQVEKLDNAKTGDGSFRIGGTGRIPGSFRIDGGRFDFGGETVSGERFVLTNVVATLGGALRQEGGTRTEIPAVYQFVPAADHAVFSAVKPASGETVPTARYRFDGFTCGKRAAFYGPGNEAGRTWCVFAGGTTNVFEGHVVLPSPIGYLTFEPGAVVRFGNGAGFGGATYFALENAGSAEGGTVVFEKRITALGGGGMIVRNGNVFRFEASNNATVNNSGTSYAFYDSSRCEMAVDNAICSTDTYYWNFVLSNTSTLDIKGTTQFISGEFLAGSKTAVITGEPGSNLRLHYGTVKAGATGGVSLSCVSTDYLQPVSVTNSVATTAGDVIVESGLMRFSRDSVWTNVAHVVVRADVEPKGRLQLDSAKTFGRDVVVRLDAGAVLDLPHGGLMKCAELWIGGVKQEDGIYDAASLPGVITGGGRLQVGRFGFRLIVR